MFKDFLVPKSIKNSYIRKPISTRKFIRRYEKRTGIKINPDIKRVFKKLYCDSYRTTAQFVHIFGPKGSGKTLLCEMIAIYDAVRYFNLAAVDSELRLFDRADFQICVLDNRMQSYLHQDLLRIINSFGLSHVKARVVTPNHINELFGLNPQVYIDESDHSDNMRLVQAFNRFVSNCKKPLNFGNHYIITYDMSEKDTKEFTCDGIQVKINLKGNLE